MSRGGSSSGSRRVPRVAVDGLTAGSLVLIGDRAHHLGTVMRVTAGDLVVLFDGSGSQAEARVVRADRGRIMLEVDEPKAQPPPAMTVTVGVAAPKGERADWLVEKLTEVGVVGVVWLQCERGVAVPRRGGSKTERWLRLARAAASQAGRASIPTLRGPMPLSEFLTLRADGRYIGSLVGQPLSSSIAARTLSSLSSALLAIGPEGGFTADEMIEAEQAGYTPVSFGPYTMRVETAAVVGAAVLVGAGDTRSSGNR